MGSPAATTRHDVASDTPASFAEWVDARYGALVRLASLASGDSALAEEAVVAALARVSLAWRHLHSRDERDAYVRRALFRQLRRSWRETLDLLQPHGDDRPGARGTDLAPMGARETAGEFLDSLTPRRRAVLVLRLFEALPEEAVAAALGISAGVVGAETDQALADWRQRLVQHPELARPESFAPEASRPAARDPVDVLTESLVGLADAGPPAPPDHATIRARAEERRRLRRRILASALLVVVLVSVSVAYLRLRPDSPAPALPKYEGPTALPDPSRSPTREPSRLVPQPGGFERHLGGLSRLPVGRPPAVGYTDGREFVAPGGRRTPLEIDDPSAVTAVAAYAGGFLVAVGDRPEEGAVSLLRLGVDGQRIWTRCSGGSPTVGPDGSVAFATWPEPCASDDGRFTAVTVAGRGPDADRVYSGRLVVSGLRGDRVVLTPGHSPDLVFLGDPAGGVRPLTGLGSAGAVDPTSGLISGQAEGDRFRGLIVDPESEEVRTTIPGWQLGRFSPDGQHLLGNHLQLGKPSVGVFEVTTGRRVVELTGGVGEEANEAVWEGDTHLLVVVGTERGTEAVVRVGFDGSVDLATPLAPAGTYHLAARP